jgi:hypothetical protein
MRQEEVRDSLWASDRDFRSVVAAPERLLWLARRDVREWPQVRRLRDASQKAAYRMALLASAGLQAVLVPQAVLLKALTALRQPPADESVLLRAQSSQVQQALRLEEPPLLREPAPWAPLEQSPQALPPRSASPPARQEPPAHSVSQRQARRSLAEAPQASSAQPLQPRPSLLFPPWQPLLLALPLRPLPESSCAPSRRRPRESSSSASSFP